MSIRHLNATFQAGPEVNGAKRLVLLALADWANDEGYCYPKREQIAAKAGIKRLDTVTEHLSWLEQHGWIVRKINEWAGMTGNIPIGKRPNVYKVLLPEERGPRNPGRGAPRNPRTHGSPESGEENHHLEPPIEPTPPVVPLGEGDGNNPGTLFDDKPTARTERLTAHERRSQTVEASFAPWWESYPSGKSRGQRGQALKAWRRVVTDKGRDRNGDPITSADLHRRLANYRAARALYHDHWAEHGIEARAPLMNGSTFINSKSSLWADEWTLDDVAGYWPPPRGSSWDDPADNVRGESIHDILEAEIAADLAAREAREAQTVG